MASPCCRDQKLCQRISLACSVCLFLLPLEPAQICTNKTCFLHTFITDLLRLIRISRKFTYLPRAHSVQLQKTRGKTHRRREIDVRRAGSFTTWVQINWQESQSLNLGISSHSNKWWWDLLIKYKTAAATRVWFISTRSTF